MQNIQRDIFLIKVLKTLSLFSQPEFPAKGGDLPKLDWLQDVPERVNIIQSLFFPESLG